MTITGNASADLDITDTVLIGTENSFGLQETWSKKKKNKEREGYLPPRN
jgi:hypothetical protein